MIVYIDGTRAALSGNVLAMAKSTNASSFTIDGKSYKVLKRYQSTFNKGVFNYLLEES